MFTFVPYLLSLLELLPVLFYTPALLSEGRYVWLHRQHSIHTYSRLFLPDLISLLARYHPRSKIHNPQGRPFKSSNQWAIPYTLAHAVHECFLTSHELFASPLNYSMTDSITYVSAFTEDSAFGAIHDAFDFRWAGSCLCNPEYEPADMHKAVTHALACSESSETPLLVVLILQAWEDSPWQAESIRQHPHMETLLRLEKGHLKVIPHDKQLDAALQPNLLTPADWPVEMIIIANKKGRDAFLDTHRLHRILVPALREVCQVPDQHHIPLWPRAGIGNPQPSFPTQWIGNLRPIPLNTPPRMPDTSPREGRAHRCHPPTVTPLTAGPMTPPLSSSRHVPYPIRLSPSSRSAGASPPASKPYFAQDTPSGHTPGPTLTPTHI